MKTIEKAIKVWEEKHLSYKLDYKKDLIQELNKIAIPKDALREIIKKIRVMPNRDDSIMPKGTYKLKLGILDGGGVGCFEVIKLLEGLLKEEEKNGE